MSQAVRLSLAVAAACACVAVLLLAAAAVLLLAAVAFGADPTTTPVEVFEGGDLRSEGAGPGLVGNPLLILAAVIGLGLATALVTVVIARVLGRD